ncbi:unnamed protein product, partial [Iphiclides podalirius]
MTAKGFVEQLNCEPGDLKERFLNCMKQLDEFTYLITDFNLAVNKLEAIKSNMELAPVHDSSIRALPAPPPSAPFNLMDVLTEHTPSTSKTCPNQCPSEKPTRNKVPKEDQLLIAFSSSSCSAESVPQTKSNTTEKEVQCNIVDNTKKISNNDTLKKTVFENYNLPAQRILQTDQEYSATILNVDGISFWVCTEDPAEVHDLIAEMTVFYQNNYIELSPEDATLLTYCACYEDHSDSYYRALFISLTEEDNRVAEVFLMDSGEVHIVPIVNLQPLAKRFCAVPPYARCCHLAGVDLLSNNNDLHVKLEEFLKRYIGTVCTVVVDDNTSESLGVYVRLPSKAVLNTLLVEQGLAQAIERVNLTDDKIVKGPPEMFESEIDITDCPEHEDPVVAVTLKCPLNSKCLNIPEQVPSFGVVLPPTNLDSLVRDMNSPAARMAYKPLKMSPAPGELVAALYPMDDQWYRARVLSSTRADQNVEARHVIFLSLRHAGKQAASTSHGKSMQLFVNTPVIRVSEPLTGYQRMRSQ